MHLKVYQACVIICFGLMGASAVRVSWNLTESCGINQRPTIGILMQAVEEELLQYGKAYIMATYIKYVESAGGRPVHIFTGRSDDYYETVFSKINGLLIPGGDVDPYDSPFSKAAQKLFNLAMEANKDGDFFPVWGTCLGMQVMTYLTTGEELLGKMPVENRVLPLDYTHQAKESRLLGWAPADVFETLATQNVTPNFHHSGLPYSTYLENEKLKQFFRVLSTNVDDNGNTFVSTIEAWDYPFYGIQWHPEKNMYEWTPLYHLNHGPPGVSVAQYTANFLLNEARKSCHHFVSIEEELKYLIYQVAPRYIPNKDYMEFYYFFDP